MATEKAPKKPSLIHPDLTGLWSVARLGHDKTYWSNLAGVLVITIFLYSWFGGLLLPFFIIFLFRIAYYNTVFMILSVLLLSYLVPISPQPWICRLYMKYGAHYFDGGCSMSFEAKPNIYDSNIPMCTPAHPHGIFCISYFLGSGIRFRAIDDIKDKEKRKEIVGVISQYDHIRKRLPYKGVLEGYLSKAPIFHFLITKLTGCIESASRKNIKALMRKKESFGILPGGFDEATLFRKGENAIFIRKRKGFIKYCLQFGYEIVPTYFFGECETYNNLFHSKCDNDWINAFKYWLNQRKIPTVFPVGQYWFSPFLPFKDIGLHCIFSKNTRCQQIDIPTQQDIDDVHKWYIHEVIDVFERNKWRFGYDQYVKLKVL